MLFEPGKIFLILNFLFLLGCCSHLQGAHQLSLPTGGSGHGVADPDGYPSIRAHRAGVGRNVADLVALSALSLIDYDTHLLPDDITLPLLWVGLLANTLVLLTTLPPRSLVQRWGHYCFGPSTSYSKP